MAIACTICGSSEFLTLNDRYLNIYYCASCDHEFTAIDGNQHMIYTKNYYDSQHANWFNNPNYSLFEFIYMNAVRLLKKEEFKILDVGCGKGDLLRFIRGRNSKAELVGIDVDRNYHPEIEFINGDFLTEKITMKFDIVCSLASIEHVADVNAFIKKMGELLLPGGFLVIMTVNAGGILYRLAKSFKMVGINRPFYRLYDLHHVNHFTECSLKKLIKKNELDIIIQRKHNYPLRAVDLPEANFIMKIIYTLGVGVLFSLPDRFGILQTIICKSEIDRLP